MLANETCRPVTSLGEGEEGIIHDISGGGEGLHARSQATGPRTSPSGPTGLHSIRVSKETRNLVSGKGEEGIGGSAGERGASFLGKTCRSRGFTTRKSLQLRVGRRSLPALRL